jgi:hypothetical protein
MTPDKAVVEPGTTPPAPITAAPTLPITILDDDVPLFGSATAWALLNLILCALGFVGAVATAVVVLLRRKSKLEDEAARKPSNNKNEGKENELDKEKQRRYRRTWAVAAGVVSVLNVVVFLFTEDMSLPMTWVDIWTIANAILFVIEMVTITLVLRRNASILFVTNGAGDNFKEKVPFGETLRQPNPPKKENALFAGWYTETECKTLWDFEKKVESDFKLYAKWGKAVQSAAANHPAPKANDTSVTGTNIGIIGK